MHWSAFPAASASWGPDGWNREGSGGLSEFQRADSDRLCVLKILVFYKGLFISSHGKPIKHSYYHIL